MKLKTLKLYTLVLFSLAATVFFINSSHAQETNFQETNFVASPIQFDGNSTASIKRAAHIWFSSMNDAQQGGQGEKTVEQARKNIQVLKGMPDSQLIPTMQFFGTSLGVNCAFCHVKTGDKWEFDKDDKPAKTTARKMILMQFDINKNNRALFDGNAVSCYTCHNGRQEPLVTPTLPLAPQTNDASRGPRSTEPLPTVDAILDKNLQALGGKAAYDKLKTRMMKGTETGADGTVIPFEIYQTSSNKYVAMFTTPKMGVFSSGYNGTTGWTKNARGQHELSGEQLEEIKREADFSSLLHLKEMYPNMVVRGRRKIGERETYVVVSTAPDKSVTRLFFDTQTGLLLRILTLTPTMIAPLPEQTDFDDYRDVDGIKLPFTIQHSSVDMHGGWTRKITEIKHNVTVDEAKFNMPPASTPAPQK